MGRMKASVTDRLHVGLLAGFKEDWDMIHAQARVLAQDPSFKMMPLGVDAALGYFRALVGKRIKEEQQAERQQARQEARPPVMPAVQPCRLYSKRRLPCPCLLPPWCMR